MRMHRRTKARGQSIVEMAGLLCLIAAVTIPAIRLFSRTTRDTIAAAIEFNSHSAMTRGEAVGTPVYSYGEPPPEEPAGQAGEPPNWPAE